MSKIVELKIDEIQNVVGGVNAVSVDLSAGTNGLPGGTPKPAPRPPLPPGGMNQHH